MEVTEHRSAETVWMRAAGEWDLAAADRVSAALGEQCALGRCLLRLDLSAVTFMDCACLGVLVDAHHRFLSAGGALILSGAAGFVARLLHLAALDGVFFRQPLAVR